MAARTLLHYTRSEHRITDMTTPTLRTGSRQIRAQYTADSLIVYQAFSAEIANAALRAQTFTSPFRLNRMTWIKPSFLWMMYRSGCGTRPGQDRILAVEITRQGFEWALSHSCLSRYDPAAYSTEREWRELLATSPVRIQWDPDRDLLLRPQSARAIQVGLAGEAVLLYVSSWIKSIRDVTTDANTIRTLVEAERLGDAQTRLPKETIYALPNHIRRSIGAD